MKIEGVDHEFTTIPEVAEDVTDIVLNLKEVLLRMHTNEEKTLRIEVEGPKEVKAGDIIADDQDVEILNPGPVIPARASIAATTPAWAAQPGFSDFTDEPLVRNSMTPEAWLRAMPMAATLRSSSRLMSSAAEQRRRRARR